MLILFFLKDLHLSFARLLHAWWCLCHGNSGSCFKTGGCYACSTSAGFRLTLAWRPHVSHVRMMHTRHAPICARKHRHGRHMWQINRRYTMRPMHHTPRHLLILQIICLFIRTPTMFSHILKIQETRKCVSMTLSLHHG